MFNVETRLALVNVIHFQGFWEKPFDTRLTTEWPFHLSNSITDTVHLMKMTDTWFNYGVSPELKARLLQMKYEGGEASMVIVLPDEVEGLNAVLKKLAKGHNIMADIESLKSTEVDVMLPKFKGKSTLDLTLLLPKLGIKSICDKRKSDIEMLTSNEKLFGSETVQNAAIVVDEQNSTKIAAGISTFRTDDVSRIHDGTPRFIANRPFLYLVNVRGLPIFLGSFHGTRHELNYSCYHVHHLFSLSVYTFYSRYDNTREQRRLMETYHRFSQMASRAAIIQAEEENVRNRAREEVLRSS